MPDVTGPGPGVVARQGLTPPKVSGGPRRRHPPRRRNLALGEVPLARDADAWRAGLCLAVDYALLPSFTGVLGPVTAMGGGLTNPLRAAGQSYEVIELAQASPPIGVPG